MTSKHEPQLTKARIELISAFRRLLMTRTYDDIHVPDIVREADLARSTFYAHFRNKNDILRASMSGLISNLSVAGFPERNLVKLTATLKHIRENPDLCRICLNTSISVIVVELLAADIRQRLLRSLSERANVDSNAARFTSIQTAEASAGLIRAWISDPHPVPPEWIAQQLDASARVLTSLVTGRRAFIVGNQAPFIEIVEQEGLT